MRHSSDVRKHFLPNETTITAPQNKSSKKFEFKDRKVHFNKNLPNLCYKVIFPLLPSKGVTPLVSISSFSQMKLQLKPLKANQRKSKSRIANCISMYSNQASFQNVMSFFCRSPVKLLLLSLYP